MTIFTRFENHGNALDFAPGRSSLMVRVEVRIRGPVGLHARPAADFVRVAEKFKARIRLAKDGVWVNGRSILSILTLAAESGSTVVIEANGDDEKEALRALKAMLEHDA
jgi:phosphocarrier protein